MCTFWDHRRIRFLEWSWLQLSNSCETLSIQNSFLLLLLTCTTHSPYSSSEIFRPLTIFVTCCSIPEPGCVMHFCGLLPPWSTSLKELHRDAELQPEISQHILQDAIIPSPGPPHLPGHVQQARLPCIQSMESSSQKNDASQLGDVLKTCSCLVLWPWERVCRVNVMFKRWFDTFRLRGKFTYSLLPSEHLINPEHYNTNNNNNKWQPYYFLLWCFYFL